jgi:3'-phosphoadenosine 5'-phosphosulfate sulfotransferase (PAPS reductase)/FAD synthetase
LYSGNYKPVGACCLVVYFPKFPASPRLSKPSEFCMILVSVSGGKDSTATLLVAKEQHGVELVQAAFADTGNEHEATYAYVRHLEDAIGVPIKWLRQDFSVWWALRRIYIAEKWPSKGVPDSVVARALAVYDTGPTGNPFLDLCIIKNRFPSRMAQFCTQFLKSEPLTEYALELIDQFGAVESWQGVRADESPNRAKLPEREDGGGGYSIYRPILKWNVDQVFAKHREHGIKPNPLYSRGMSRVGCMPCINAQKAEIREIAKRFPEHIDRIEEWESIVALVSKRHAATFFASPGDNETAHERGNIRQVVEWSKTTRGGKQRDLLGAEILACSSAYGLCE